MKTIRSIRLRLLTLAAAVLSLATLRAQLPPPPVNWGTPANIVGDADVSTTGMLVAAYNLGATGISGATVNGVAFTAFGVRADNSVNATNTLGNFSLHFDERNAYNSFGSTQTPFASLSASYQTLLGSAAFDEYSYAVTLTMSGLTVGQAYAFQFWVCDSANRLGYYNLTATSGNSVTLLGNTSRTIGGLGQYVVGTFTANATNQVVSFDSEGGAPEVNAFQLRAIPEPSTWALLGLGGAGLGAVTLRRRRAVRA